jgi:hypothetical protein
MFKNKRAPGPDEISVEVIRRSIALLRYGIFLYMLQIGSISDTWEEGVIASIF